MPINDYFNDLSYLNHLFKKQKPHSNQGQSRLISNSVLHIEKGHQDIQFSSTNISIDRIF